MIDFKALAAPFPADKVHWRVGSTSRDKARGLALAYIDARDVMERLDAVCGPQNWQCRYPHANGKTVCDIGINVHGTSQQRVRPEDDGSIIVDTLWVWKADGAGDTDYEAEKGALSDAFKRAAVRWGIGRNLYDLGNIWVEIEPAGKSFKIKDSELPKLRRLLTGAAPTPEPKPAPKPATNSRPTWADWIANAKKEIQACRTSEEVGQWKATNEERLEALKDRSTENHTDLIDFMNQAWADKPANIMATG